MTGARLGIRQSVFLVLLILVATMTAMFLLLVGFTVRRQIERTSVAELAASRRNFEDLERQRQDMLLRQTALLSELPSLKALMTTNDPATIVDGGRSFWQTSGSDLFALMHPDGSVAAVYSNGRLVPPGGAAAALPPTRLNPYRATLIVLSGRLFEVATQPISFAAGEQRRLLGYITTGYELNDRFAQMIGRDPQGQVVLAVPGRIIASTLSLQDQALLPLAAGDGRIYPLAVGHVRWLAASFLLQAATRDIPPVYLVLLRSDVETAALLRRLNTGVIAIGVLLLFIGGAVALALAGTVTRPLQSLLESTRQMGRGEPVTAVPSSGPLELRELRGAFENMHAQVVLSQATLLEGERQATIGRMAGSISHDLRHYLSPIYANAEFLSSDALSTRQRDELLGEIMEAARGMNQMLDAVLTFSRTGIAVQPALNSIPAAVRRALTMVQTHPEAAGVSVHGPGPTEYVGWIDSKELQRAVYNLLLNACQAARSCPAVPAVLVTVHAETDPNRAEAISICIRDNGSGIREEIAPRLFQPFVSAGKESGLGLGLALVKRIAEAHGGGVETRRLEEAGIEWTEFALRIPSAPPGTAPDAAAAKDAVLGASL